MKKWKTLYTETLYKHPRLTLVEDTVLLPNGHRTEYLMFGNQKDSVMVICIDKDKVLVQREYAYPIKKRIFQFPGGAIEHGESIESAANRELAEESNLTARNWKNLGWIYTNIRRTNVKMHIMLASDFRYTDALASDIEEEISSEWIPMAELESKIRNNTVHNSTVLIGWALYKSLQCTDVHI